MPITIVSMMVLLGAQGIVQPLPKFQYNPALTPGQREVALGPELQPDVTMEVRYEHETPAQFTPHKILGPSNMVYAQGYVRWSVIDGNLFDKPCRIIKMDGITKGENVFKINKIQYSTRNTTTYWVALDGKLLRQSVHLLDPTGPKVAECVFWSDHIEVSVADQKGRRSFTVYPKVDLSLIDLQFRPMIVADKIVLSYKEYFAFDPFDQSFTKYKASVGGSFHGSFLATKFDGLHVDIEGPKGVVKAFVSKEGDLIKVDFPKDQSLVLNYLPRSKDPMYLKQVGASGKG